MKRAKFRNIIKTKEEIRGARREGGVETQLVKAIFEGVIWSKLRSSI